MFPAIVVLKQYYHRVYPVALHQAKSSSTKKYSHVIMIDFENIMLRCYSNRIVGSLFLLVFLR